MKKKALGLQVLWWSEIVVSICILFFTIPVIFIKQLEGNFSPINIDDWAILAFTITAFLYAMVGVASIIGHHLWRQFHYLVTALIFSLSVGLFKRMETIGIDVQWTYFIPMLVSIIITGVLILRLFTKKDPKQWQSVLVVDDDETLIKTIRPILMNEGFSVLTAESGEEGLDVAKTQKPDVIILDVILPGIKGRDVCKKLKEDPETSSIPVVFLTAKDSKDDIEAEMEVGGEVHLTKPFDKKGLIAVLKKVLAS